MRTLVLLVLSACAVGTSNSAAPVRPIDRDEPSDDPSDLPGSGDSSQGVDSVAAPPPAALEHVCSGTEPYEYVWPVAPQSLFEAPQWGWWQYRALSEDGASGDYWSWRTPDMKSDGVISSYCYCEPTGVCSAWARYILVPINR